MIMSDEYAAGLSSTLRGASVPYGYTLTIWCSGQLLSDFRGSPRMVTMALFVAGGAVAFALLRWLARETQPEVPAGSGGERQHLVLAIALQMGAIATALGTVAIVAQIPSGVDWLLAGFLATSVYMAVTAAGVAMRS